MMVRSTGRAPMVPVAVVRGRIGTWRSADREALAMLAEGLGGREPPGIRKIVFEGLPSMDGSFAIEAIATVSNPN